MFLLGTAEKQFFDLTPSPIKSLLSEDQVTLIEKSPSDIVVKITCVLLF